MLRSSFACGCAFVFGIVLHYIFSGELLEDPSLARANHVYRRSQISEVHAWLLYSASALTSPRACPPIGRPMFNWWPFVHICAAQRGDSATLYACTRHLARKASSAQSRVQLGEGDRTYATTQREARDPWIRHFAGLLRGADSKENPCAASGTGSPSPALSGNLAPNMDRLIALLLRLPRGTGCGIDGSPSDILRLLPTELATHVLGDILFNLMFCFLLRLWHSSMSDRDAASLCRNVSKYPFLPWQGVKGTSTDVLFSATVYVDDEACLFHTS